MAGSSRRVCDFFCQPNPGNILPTLKGGRFLVTSRMGCNGGIAVTGPFADINAAADNGSSLALNPRRPRMDSPTRFDRRHFVGMLAGMGAFAALGGTTKPSAAFATDSGTELSVGELQSRELVRFPDKVPLILLTDRPPQLETPLQYFFSDLTPNDAFFVRWHLSGIPTSVDLRTFRLEVSGLVQKPLSLSLDELKSKFEPISVVAVGQCAGNSRSFFRPMVPGGQWTHGAMGNAQWKGARLKDVLDAANVRAGATEVYLRGLDVPPLKGTPPFEKSLKLDHARDGEVMIAYEMNGEPFPMLNGFPIRLVVPGWYATYWVKSLSAITVSDEPLKSFWMQKAYRIPNNPAADEDPSHQSQDTIPIHRMAVHSVFLRPEPGEKLLAGRSYQLEGLAMDGGSEIRRVEVSKDGGQTWSDVSLDPEIGKYSWRRWRADWIPPARGNYRLMARATNAAGEAQLASQWNHSGYQRSVIEHLDAVVL